MFACLFIPDFPVEAFVCLEPELRLQPCRRAGRQAAAIAHHRDERSRA